MKKLFRFKIKYVVLAFGMLVFIWSIGVVLDLYWQDRARQISKQQELQNIITVQQEELNSTKQKIENVEKQSQKPAQKTLQTVITPESSYSAIVNKWKDEVAYIECDFKNKDTGEVLLTQTGSGYYMGGDGIFFVVTNLHVVRFDYEGKSKYSNGCRVKLLNDTQTVYVPYEKISAPSTAGADVALLSISSPTAYMIKNPSEVHNTCRRPEDNFKGGVDIGDKVLVFGYPGIGSQTGITVTEGIISGIDFPYYITSAKIEHGNSGGIAVLVKNGCNLGIPTNVAGGELESLGRVFDSVQAMVELFYDIN